jgi:hypothetical protein
MRRVWTGKNGTKYKIREMETSHIKNCIAMLERVNEKRLAQIYAFAGFFQGEQAEYAADDAIRDLEANGFGDDDPVEQYLDAFMVELRRREDDQR